MSEIEPLDDGHGFEERADQLTDHELLSGTIVVDHFDDVHRALLARGLVLIIGPRGCGKTHMMRYASLVCRDNQNSPFAAYVSFNRYLRLEPLLGARPDAIRLFHGWVLARILGAAQEMLTSMGVSSEGDLCSRLDLSATQLSIYVDHIERGIPPTVTDEETAEALTISGVAEVLRAAANAAGRKRVVVLLDDAALTLTPEFLVEFFDIVRVLKASDIAPKASVYPGTTEYGPRFHADHEGRSVPVWLSVNDPSYVSIMRGIAANRYPDADAINEDVHHALMYAAFGVPRAYLTMLREWNTRGEGSEQAKLNRIIQDHRDARVSEYRTLALKLPKLATLVKTGEKLFGSMIEALREANDSEPRQSHLLVAVPSTDVEPMPRRMINLLIEAGLVREEPEVSHGPDRKYVRLGPHVGALLAARTLGLGRGGGARRIAEAMSRPLAKHPVRRALKKLVDPSDLERLRLDLPPCQSCAAERLSDSQRFCHICGNKLLDDSVYSRCTNLPIDEVPGLTTWMRGKIVELGFRTVGDLMGVQDPGTELRKIKQVGPQRSTRALDKINLFIDEFLS